MTCGQASSPDCASSLTLTPHPHCDEAVRTGQTIGCLPLPHRLSCSVLLSHHPTCSPSAHSPCLFHDTHSLFPPPTQLPAHHPTCHPTCLSHPPTHLTHPYMLPAQSTIPTRHLHAHAPIHICPPAHHGPCIHTHLPAHPHTYPTHPCTHALQTACPRIHTCLHSLMPCKQACPPAHLPTCAPTSTTCHPQPPPPATTV